MSSLNVVVLGEKPEARAAAAAMLGKKGSADDLAFYHTAVQGKIVSAIDPAAYPAKLSCMMQALNLADHALVLAEEVTPVLGECIVALNLMGLKAVFVGENELIGKLIENTGLKGSKVCASVGEARDYLMGLESGVGEEADAAEAVALIDHCFEVKGIGTVALGIVRQGVVRVHDKMRSVPLGKELEVRSIQMNDQDVKEAHAGDRLGIALKGVKAEEVGRGEVFCKSNEGAEPAKIFKCEVAAVKFAKAPLETGAYHLSAGLQFEPCKLDCQGAVKPGTSAQAKIGCERIIALEKKGRMVLCNLNAKGVRVLAGVKPGEIVV
ncbi:MAG: EF-Tu/IF-2/RF-3 family GTPase [Candidatus Burarchaeum sp.]|nr:EF-Tu/IF-2/RF-3 family GTPase [Candidatus Burarchaeum sp.]MDO8339302.1 EF-Tu/IF-2/RF-3 family GTPase [Candidatus Burarchaeum sp.]